MESSEKFCLKWNDFETNISTAFREIREEKDLLDCTLSCGPQQLQAHKLILSACSPFFRTVFKQNPHPHPLLFLKGISYTDLQAIITFMYHGEVNVAQEDLSNFLQVAEELKVKGLSEQEKRRSSNTVKHQAPSQSIKPPPPMKMAPRLPAPVIPSIQENVDDIQEVEAEVKTEPGASGLMEQYQGGQEVVTAAGYEEGYEYGDFGEQESYVMDTADQEKDPSSLVEQFLDSSVYPVVEKFRCQACWKIFNDRSNCRRHVKSAHFSVDQVACLKCGRFYKNKRSVVEHCRTAHPEMYLKLT